jgi:hypothetical protein
LCPIDQEPAQLVGVVGGVGQAHSRVGQRLKQVSGEGSIAPLPGGYLEGDEAPFAIDDSVDLGRATAARAPGRLNFGPPFPPPAERRALALVTSIIWMSSGLTST